MRKKTVITLIAAFAVVIIVSVDCIADLNKIELLNRKLSDRKDKIAASSGNLKRLHIDTYNSSATEFNVMIHSFPTSLYNRIFLKLEKKKMLGTNESKTVANKK